MSFSDWAMRTAFRMVMLAWVHMVGTVGAVAGELKYSSLLAQCPMTTIKYQETSTIVLNSVVANVSSTEMVRSNYVADDFLDFSPVVASLYARDFKYQETHPYWTARVVTEGVQSVRIPGGWCELVAIDVLPADRDAAGRIVPLQAAELRFVLENCDVVTRHLVISIYVLPQATTGDSVEEKYLIPWMCAVRGFDCREEAKRAQIKGVPVTTPEPGANVISINRKIEEKKITSVNANNETVSGKCNNPGIGIMDGVSATSYTGCQLECVQRMEMDMGGADVDVSHECVGYAWNTQWQVGDPGTGCVLYYELPHSDNKVISADGDKAWVCYSLTVTYDTYQHSTHTSTTSVTTTTPAPILGDTPLSLFELSSEPTMATRKMVSRVPDAGGSACFEDTDWYVLDRTLNVNAKHWKWLSTELAAQNVAEMAESVPSQVLLDRVCVMGSGGRVPKSCEGDWLSLLFPLLVLSNLCCAAILLYIFCEKWCRREDGVIRVKEVVYEDGSHENVLNHGGYTGQYEQSIDPRTGTHQYVFRDRIRQQQRQQDQNDCGIQ